MIEHLPSYISLIFGFTTFATLGFFYFAIKRSNDPIIRNKANIILAGLLSWLVLQVILPLNQVYNTNTQAVPPKIFAFGVLPMLVSIILLFATQNGRRFIDSLPLVTLTWLNIVRIPVELVLYWLFLNKAVPELMTFEGRNFDILSGITAPIIAYYGISKGKLNKQWLLAWNLICLGLLLNIVINAVLSIPTPLQKFAFDQPNIAVLHFPFNWLPSFIVPVVLFGHLASIRRLIKSK